MDDTDWLTIGQVAARAGLAPSALRFYEAEGLIRARRSGGGQRRFHRDVLRRVAFVRVAQRVGLTIQEVRAALGTLPAERTPTKDDWARLSRSWQPRLDEQIATLQRLRDRLTSCIGCGCLSFKACALYNPSDAAARLGAGPRYLLGDAPEAATAVAARPAPSARKTPRRGATRRAPVVSRSRRG
ncbi:redox-sensitive transcriptional activator SoxR [Candidatus Binatia bacterium]|nr:redox-sensitive transcriptional activator SoxR [Candidatus Binatia bacterium]